NGLPIRLHTTTTTMPQEQSYAVSVNPARRAKQSSFRTLLPQPASPPSTDGSEFEPTSVSGPAKRGRKPGPLSRAARESQRKLNHSIIEKARRTKINDALTSLKHLVPPGYGHQPSQPGSEDEEGKKKKGKREEKDKEFKLEILERTVVFLQDLLKRVEILEANATSSANPPPICTKCSSSLSPSSQSSTPNPNPILEQEPLLKRKRSLSFNSSPFNVNLGAEFSHKRPCPGTSPRLPPISSWLHNSDSVPVPFPARQMEQQVDPQVFNLLGRISSENAAFGLFSTDKKVSVTMGLPSPPTSTHFLPQQHPLPSPSVPTLHLGASANASTDVPHNSSGPFTLFESGGLRDHSSSSSRSRSPPMESVSHRILPSLLSPGRTPEDESAASLLLQISAGASETSPMLAGVAASQARYSVGTGNENMQAQTPGSMLGLVQVRKG
ncbi:hypothetical protein C0993_002366, partial [Termitomyces sp. T159_Od127]